MQKIYTNRLLRIDAVYIRGNSKPLRDRYAFIFGRFLILGESEDDSKPKWYNLDRIDRLEGVEQLPAARYSQAVFWS